MKGKLPELRMRGRFIAWVIQGKKIATTRLTKKKLGTYELVCPESEKINAVVKIPRDRVRVTINHVVKWKWKGVRKSTINEIALGEGFAGEKDFRDALLRIYGKDAGGKTIKESSVLFTHYFVDIETPERLRYVYGKRPT